MLQIAVQKEMRCKIAVLRRAPPREQNNLLTCDVPYKKTISFFEWFPYVCPEPVLVKTALLYINGSKRPFAHLFEIKC
jgi:hypothetical protein